MVNYSSSPQFHPSCCIFQIRLMAEKCTRTFLTSHSFYQDGSILCPRAGRSQCSAPPNLHVLPVLGSDVLQRSSRASFQGLQIQQLLHGAVAARAVPQPPTCRLHYYDALSILRLRAIQVGWEREALGCSLSCMRKIKGC